MQNQTFVFDEETPQEKTEIGQSEIESVFNTNWEGDSQSVAKNIAPNPLLKSVYVQLPAKVINTSGSNENPIKDIKSSIDELFIHEPVENKKLTFKTFDSRTENASLLQKYYHFKI